MKIFGRCFETLTEEDIKIMKEYFRGYNYGVSSYTFLANYIWRKTYCLCWELRDDYLYMSGMDCKTKEPTAIIAMPLTKTGEYDIELLRKGILETKEKFRESSITFSIEAIPESLVPVLEEAFPGQLEFENDRDEDEYVYLKEKLITLSGRALHKKKNHMNYFKKTYEYEARSLGKNDTEIVMELVKRLMNERDISNEEERTSLEVECEAISETMALIENEGVYSIGIFHEGELIGFSLGELLNEDTAVAHFEKGLDSYRGVYQIIASEFCKSLPENVVYVNREEDMGIENLRKSKEALKPDHMVKKYSARFCK